MHHGEDKNTKGYINGSWSWIEDDEELYNTKMNYINPGVRLDTDVSLKDIVDNDAKLKPPTNQTDRQMFWCTVDTNIEHSVFITKRIELIFKTFTLENRLYMTDLVWTVFNCEKYLYIQT